jgi:hypothetical protein
MKKLILHTCILLSLVLLFPKHSNAAGIFFDINRANIFSATGASDSTFAKKCSKLTESHPNRITGNIVRCANYVINIGGDRIIVNFVKPFSALVFYAVIIAIIFFAIQMMYGVARKDITLLFVIKILAVMFVCGPQGYTFLKNTRNVLIGFPKNIASSLVSDPSSTHDKLYVDENNPDQLIPEPNMIQNPNDPTGPLIQDPDEPYIQEHDITLTGFVLDITGIKNLVCKPDGKTAIGTDCPDYRMEDVYDKFDESILKIFGVSDTDISSGQKNPELFMGVIVLVVGLFFTGAWGLSFAIQLILLATATLFMIAQMVLFFLVVAIAINILVAITPLAMACLLFKSTENITKKWFTNLFVYSLQPIILVAFMVVTVTILKSLTDKFDEANIYPRVKEAISNPSGSSDNKMTIFNCFGASSTSDAVTSQISNPDSHSGLVAYVQQQNMANNINIYGNAVQGGEQQTSKQDCNVKAFAFNIHRSPERVPMGTAGAWQIPCTSTDPAVDPLCYDDGNGNWISYTLEANKIYEGDLTTLTALNITIIILQLIMRSFIKQMPSMIAGMTGGAGVERAAEIATNPTDKFLPEVAQKAQGLVGGLTKRY